MTNNPTGRKTLSAAGAAGVSLRRGLSRRPFDEDLYQGLFEHCPIGLAVLGRDRSILNVNPSLRAMLGYSDGKIMGRFLLDVTHPEDAAATEQMIGRLFRSQVDSLQLENRFLRRDGTWFWGNLTVALIPWRGEARHVLAVVEDISSRKKMEADLIRSNVDLELYASIAAHDLQEPVRQVITYGEILSKMRDRLPDEGRHALAKSQHAALRMKELIEDLLEYARVNAVKRVCAPVDLNVVLKEVLSDLAVAERSGRVEVGRLPVMDADALQMRQLFQNLISNAVKFTVPGQPARVAVSAELLGGTEVRIEVKDEGIGFDEKFLDRIFKPFQRVCDRNVYEGSGIGLAICKSVVQRHGGSITAVSSPGKGACFGLFSSSPEGKMTGQLTLAVDLIVAEDNDDDFFFIDKSFKEAHCRSALIRVRDGVELMALLRERLNDPVAGTPHSCIVLLDLNMPKMDGREALKEMRADPILRRVPVVIFTTSKSDEDIIRSYDLGVNCFIRKPASFEGFVEIMDRLNKFWFELVEIPALK